MHVYVGVGVCARRVSEVNRRCGSSSSTLLEMESVVLCSLHTRVAVLQASGGSVSPSAVGALGLQMHDICYCIQLYRGVLCSECSYTYPAPSSPTLWPHPCVRKESRGAQSPHAQHTISDLSPGNCVTNRDQGGSWASVVVSPASASPTRKLGRG